MKNLIILSIQIISFLFPWRIRRAILTRILGFKIHRSGYIGITLIIAKSVNIKNGAKIGNLTFIKGLDLLYMGDYSYIGNLNWISGFPKDTGTEHFADMPERVVMLRVYDHASVTNRHLLDCTGGITIGKFSTIAGFRTQILTHSIDVQLSRQRAAPVKIGEYCFIGTGSIILANSKLPDYSILGAGSVLNKNFNNEYTLYAGVPAKPIKSIDQNYAYFHREEGYVI